jgi:hypothetical protein
MKKTIGLMSVFGLACVGSATQGCNEHPVTFLGPSGAIEYVETTRVAGAAELDLLWVIDNSGSMCQEQKVLRDNFSRFVDALAETNLDFHIAVTTTHMKDESSQEPVAIAGALQSTPQPVPSLDSTCHHRTDEMGRPIETDFQPIRDALAAAVECMAVPNRDAYDWSDDDIRCALQTVGVPDDCTISGKACGGEFGTPCKSEDLFPSTGMYRAIPNVLRSSEYTTAGVLDVDRLRADFACMSLVGVRGYGIEKGLSAAVKAVSPEMTGGPWSPGGSAANVDALAPNHGFLRSNARFGLVFVTDENDCSHDGTLNESSMCGPDICEYYNSPHAQSDSPLVPVELLQSRLLENLAASKNRPDFGVEEVLVASIHGKSRPYTGPIHTEQACQTMRADNTFTDLGPSCRSALGDAYSGDRYEKFLRTFPEGNTYPSAPAGEELTGWMCTGDFSPALEAIGEFVSRIGAGCVTRGILPCTGPTDTSCPPFPYSGLPGVCTAIDSMDVDQGMTLPPKYYCSSGIQVRTQVPADIDDVGQVLQGSGYCVHESIGSASFPRGCVVDPAHYEWEACPGGLQGIKLKWNDEVQARRRLNAMEIQIRYQGLDDDRI